MPNAALPASLEQIMALMAELESDGEDNRLAIVMASVNDPVADRVSGALKARSVAEVYRLGNDLEIPILTALAPGATPGQDRLLNALGAFEGMKQACVIVDCGTAVTVDFVDGQGVFQGGAILPGASMQLHCLHEKTAALPHVHLAVPAPEVFGKDTTQAMLNGVIFGIRGAVRALVERYAEAYEAFPPVIATGGDAPLILQDEELIDRLIPDLTLWGIHAACRKLLTDDAPDAAENPDR